MSWWQYIQHLRSSPSDIGADWMATKYDGYFGVDTENWDALKYNGYYYANDLYICIFIKYDGYYSSSLSCE